MAKVDLIDNSWVDLVFEGKNQAYGAYVLRKETGKRNVKALIWVLIGIAAIFAIAYANLAIQNAMKQNAAIETDVELSKLAQKKEAKVERKEEVKKLIFEAEMIPEFGKKIVRIDRSDGCKVWFEDGSWCICRFSGTEPLLRFAAAAQEAEDAKQYIKAWKAICVPVDN